MCPNPYPENDHRQSFDTCTVCYMYEGTECIVIHACVKIQAQGKIGRKLDVVGVPGCSEALSLLCDVSDCLQAPHRTVEDDSVEPVHSFDSSALLLSSDLTSNGLI
jgi:hypothetical protein